MSRYYTFFTSVGSFSQYPFDYQIREKTDQPRHLLRTLRLDQRTHLDNAVKPVQNDHRDDHVRSDTGIVGSEAAVEAGWREEGEMRMRKARQRQRKKRRDLHKAFFLHYFTGAVDDT